MSCDRINRIFPFYVIILIIIFSIVGSFAHAQDRPTWRILVLNSYHKGFPWVDGIVEGIEADLKAKEFNYVLKVEYMDTKNIQNNTTYKKVLYNLYTHKYADQKFDIIISSDDDAFNFLREFHKELFPDTPIVFCAVNNSDAANLIDKSIFTGVLETPDQRSMIDLVMKIHPETKKIFWVVDTSPNGTYRWEKQTVPLFSDYPDIEFIRIDDRLSILEVEEMMKNLTDDAITFYAIFSRDKTGRHISLAEAASRISKASRRPIYTFHSQDIQYGLIGGHVLDGYHQGEIAVDIAIRILRGEKVANIPVSEYSSSLFMFSYPRLERFNIKLTDLPEESIILNMPFSFYKEYKDYIWAVGFIIFILIIIVIALIANIVRRKLAENAYIQSVEKLRQLIDTIDGIVWEADANTFQFSFISKQAERLLGYPTERWLTEPTFWGDHLYPDDRDWATTFCIRMTGEKKAHDFEYRMIAADGRTVWLRDLVKVILADNKPYKLTGVMIDITKRKLIEKELHSSQETLRSLNSHIESIREDERTRISREIHDELGQKLTVLKIDLVWIQDKLGDKDRITAEKTKDMIVMLDSTIQTVKKISTDLRPGLLDDLGLVAAIDWQSKEFEKHTGTSCTLNTELEELFLDTKRATALFRIFQETLTNAARHAKATQVQVYLEKKNHLVTLRVMDNGIGISTEKIKASNSYGLIGMRERVHQLNGQINIEGSVDTGTKIIVAIPLPQIK